MGNRACSPAWYELREDRVSLESRLHVLSCTNDYHRVQYSGFAGGFAPVEGGGREKVQVDSSGAGDIGCGHRQYMCVRFYTVCPASFDL